jgi:hypothetical protein
VSSTDAYCRMYLVPKCYRLFICWFFYDGNLFYFICGLFNDAVSRSDYITPDNRLIMNRNSEM